MFGSFSHVSVSLTSLTLVYPHSHRLYEKLLKVAEKGHQKAMEKVAYAMLFGDYMSQNVTKAKDMFDKLAIEGSPKAQTVKTSSTMSTCRLSKVQRAFCHVRSFIVIM